MVMSYLITMKSLELLHIASKMRKINTDNHFKYSIHH